MRKSKILALLLILLLLQGCVYSKITLLRIKGDKVEAPIGSYTPIQGKGVTGVIVRQVFVTDEKGRKIPKVSDIKIDGDEVDKSVGGMEVKK